MEDTTISCSQWLSNPVPPGNVAFWFNPTGGTPNYMNALSCGGVPSNVFGFQFAHTGNAYLNIGCYIPLPAINDREYVSCPLLQPLVADRKYCVSFYVSLVNRAKFAIDGMGAFLSPDTPTCVGSYCLLQYSPQVFNPPGNILSDTANWVFISGEFIATGGEKFITIGNFTPDSNLSIAPTGQVSNVSCCYFIDDVSVVLIDADTSDADTDKMICSGESAQIGTSTKAGCTYQWQPPTGLNDANVAQPTASPQQSTTYILTLTDTINTTICQSTTVTTDTVIVTVRMDCPQEELIDIYNIFTPNGDLKNDVFFIKNLPANSALKIFNRWGSKVYESSNYNNNWDGGKVPDGTYFYLLVLPTKEIHRGFVEVRR